MKAYMCTRLGSTTSSVFLLLHSYRHQQHFDHVIIRSIAFYSAVLTVY